MVEKNVALYENAEAVAPNRFCVEQQVWTLVVLMWALAKAIKKAWACGILDSVEDNTNFHHLFERFETSPRYNLVGL